MSFEVYGEEGATSFQGKGEGMSHIGIGLDGGMGVCHIQHTDAGVWGVGARQKCSGK